MFWAFIIMLAILAFVPLIDFMKFESHLVPMIKEYMIITAFAIFGGYLHACLKEFLQAFEIVFFPNLITVFAVFLNIILNVVLVFGFGPIPAMGVIGLAIASFIVRYFMGFALLLYCFKIMRFNNYEITEIYYKNLVKVGLPISFAILIEFVAFNSIAVFMGQVAGIYAAAQNLVCTLTSISFMVPLALSNAIAVKVGFSNGAKNFVDLRRYAYIGMAMAVGFMACSSILFAIFPEFLVRLFTNDINLIKISVPVLYVLACFQVFDGLQVSLGGIFKGLKNTKIVMISNFICFWIFFMPVGYILAFKYNLMLIGFWIGLMSSAVLLCTIMGTVLYKKIRDMKKA